MTYVKNLEDRIEYLQSRCAQLEAHEEYIKLHDVYEQLQMLVEKSSHNEVFEKCMKALDCVVLQKNRKLVGDEYAIEESYTISRYERRIPNFCADGQMTWRKIK